MMSASGPVPIVNDGILYNNGGLVTRASNTTLTVAPMLVRDSTNTFDIYTGSTLTLNAANVGANGIDTGTFAASKMYYVYAIFDATYKVAPAVIISLSASAPVLPFGFSTYRMIAAWPTNGSTQFVLGQYTSGNGGRTFFYDAITATPLTVGASTSFAAVNLLNLVPAINATQVDFYVNFTANAAADTAAFRATGSASTNGQHIATAQVAGATAHLDQKVRLLTNLSAGNPSIDYKVSAGTLALSIEGFVLNI